MTKAQPFPEEKHGPAMQACTVLERAFVTAYMEHPNYTNGALAQHAAKLLGQDPYTAESERVVGYRMSHSERVIAAVHEEGSKRLRMGGAIGVKVMMDIAQNPMHKDQLKAATALADRTGFHATSEHKVVVDDKRPQTRNEMIEKIRQLGKEAGWTQEMIAAATGDNEPMQPLLPAPIDVEFEEVIDYATQEDL